MKKSRISLLVILLLIGTLNCFVPVWGQQEGSGWMMFRPSDGPQEMVTIEERIQN